MMQRSSSGLKKYLHFALYTTNALLAWSFVK